MVDKEGAFEKILRQRWRAHQREESVRSAAQFASATTNVARARKDWIELEHAASEIRADDVPWLSDLEIDEIIATGLDTASRRMILLRWHPDRFQSRFGHRLRDEDRDAVMARVTSTCQTLNAATTRR